MRNSAYDVDWETARLRAHGPMMIEDGQATALLQWLDSLPSDIQAVNPWVLYFRGVAMRLKGSDLQGVARVQERARELFFQSESWDGYTRSLTELGLIAPLLARQVTATHASESTNDLERAETSTVDSEELGRDRVIRKRIEQAIAQSQISEQGVRELRQRFFLTPAETQVFIAYYLATQPSTDTSQRRTLSQDLNLSENTLMHHITSIRRKLGLKGRRGSAGVLRWCIAAGMVELQGSKNSMESERISQPLSEDRA